MLECGKNSTAFYNCRCSCGKEKKVTAAVLKSGRVKTCGGDAHKESTGNPNWTGGKYISGKYLGNSIRGALSRGFEWNLTIEEIEDVFSKQVFCCAYTGLEVKFDTVLKNQTASIDRINSKEGYFKENIQIVHKDINFMKQDFSNDEFIKYCILIAEKYNTGVTK